MPARLLGFNKRSKVPFLGQKFLEMLETEPQIFFDCILTAADINIQRTHSETTPEKVHGLVGGGALSSSHPEPDGF